MLETVCLTGQLGDGIAHWVEEILFVLGLPLLVIAPRQHIDDVLGSWLQGKYVPGWPHQNLEGEALTMYS